MFQLLAAVEQDRISSKAACGKAGGDPDTSLPKLFDSQAIVEYSSTHSAIFFRDI